MLKKHKILKLTTNFTVPFIVVFALFIQINGEVSPGGGFQAGAIFASSIIGLDIIYGREKFIAKSSYLLKLSALGVAIYAITGLICLVFGSNYLNYYVLADNIHTAQSLGIFIIELGVGLCVASTLSLLYFEFSSL
jgi:multicomponent Na+:H+ antiporter subunit B